MRVIETTKGLAFTYRDFQGRKYMSVNPYKGCEYGCGYCTARIPMRMAHPGCPWGDCVEVRSNIAAELEKRASISNPVFLSTMSDPYQPLEKKYGLTRSVLEILADKGVKTRIVTHSELILKDLDILRKMDDIEVGISLFSMNDSHVEIFESKLPMSDERIELIYRLKDNGIRTFLNIEPFLPEITPLRSLINVFADEVDFIRINSPKWKSGMVKRYLFDSIKVIAPEMYVRYTTKYLNGSKYFKELKATCGSDYPDINMEIDIDPCMR